MPSQMKFRRTYGLLRQSGHGPVKALEIMLNAGRGDRQSLDWIKLCRKLRLRGGVGALIAQFGQIEPTVARIRPSETLYR